MEEKRTENNTPAVSEEKKKPKFEISRKILRRFAKDKMSRGKRKLIFATPKKEKTVLDKAGRRSRRKIIAQAMQQGRMEKNRTV